MRLYIETALVTPVAKRSFWLRRIIYYVRPLKKNRLFDLDEKVGFELERGWLLRLFVLSRGQVRPVASGQ